MKLALAAAACLAAAPCAAQEGTISLTGDAVLVIPDGLSPAVTMAFRDVQRDFYKVLGIVPVVLATPPPKGSLPAGSVVVMLGPSGSMGGYPVPSACASGWESHCVVALPASASPSGYDTLLATGSGDRGVIFGGYAFSEAILGVHPMWRFIDAPPQYQQAVAVNASLSLLYPPPLYKHRSIFPNDEDLTGGHRPDPLGRGVFSAEAFDGLLETALRCKANGVLVGTNPFPDDDNVRLVARRGMVLHHHHYNLLGSNVFRWPLPAPDWNWRKNTGTMSYLWRASIAAQAAYPEVVWSLGMRGLNDESYPYCSGDADCGGQISEALSNQTAWLKAAGQGNATRVLYLWQELLPLIAKGDLLVPPGTEIIFTDSGAGFINVDSSVPQYAYGAYYHTAMYNGNANQLTEMVPVDRMAAQWGNFSKWSKATAHAIINLSDMRPVPMTTLAWFRMVYDIAPFTAADPNTTARAFYADFGVTAASIPQASAAEFSSIWFDYFAIPFIQGGQADNFLADRLRSLASALAQAVASRKVPSTSAANSALATLGGNATHLAALACLGRAENLAPYVPSARLPFFTAHTVLNMATIGYGAHAVYLTASATLAYAAEGGPSPAMTQMATDALVALESLLAIRRQSEAGQTWSGFYFGDHLSDMNLARKAARQLVVALAAPQGVPLAPLTPFVWYYDFEAWQTEHAPNYPLMDAHPQWNLATYVRINCVTAQVDAGTCANSPSGGTFQAGSDAAFTLQVMTSQTGADDDTLVIRYTTDGSAPSPASPPYPIGGVKLAPLGPTVTISAQAWIDGTPTGQVTQAVYTARA